MGLNVDSSDAWSDFVHRKTNAVAKLGMWQYDLTSDSLSWNDGMYAIHGVAQGTPMNLDEVIQLCIPSHRDAFQSNIDQAIQHGMAYDHEYTILAPNGDTRHLRCSVEAKTNAQGVVTHLFGLCQDNTDYKHELMEHLRLQDELFQQRYAQNEHNLISITDRRGTITYVNDKFCQVSGYSRHELVGQNHNIVNSTKHDKAFWEEFWSIINDKRVWKGTICNKAKDGSLYYVKTTIFPHTDPQGRIDKFISIRTNVTQLIEAQADNSRLQSALSHSQKLEAVSVMTAGIAHDFNNILTGIVGFTQSSLLRFGQDNPKLKTNLERTMDCCKKGGSLLKRLLDFSRQTPELKESLDLKRELSDFEEILRAIVPKGITLDIDTSRCQALIKADRVQLQQVILNLVVNAKDAMTDRGTLSIKVQQKQASGVCTACHTEFDGDWMVISVTDSGCGMSNTDIGKIFNPFFSTKSRGEGTGLGLAVTATIVQNHQGHITVDSAVGRGTTFNIHLPCFLPVLQQPTTPSFDMSSLEGLDIAIIDDEPLMCKVLMTALSAFGARAYSYTSPLVFMDSVETDKRDYDVIITDYKLPQMRGTELAALYHATQPDVPIILISAFSDEVNHENFQAYGFYDFLPKPIDNKLLLSTIQNAVNTNLSQK